MNDLIPGRVDTMFSNLPGGLIFSTRAGPFAGLP